VIRRKKRPDGPVAEPEIRFHGRDERGENNPGKEIEEEDGCQNNNRQHVRLTIYFFYLVDLLHHHG